MTMTDDGPTFVHPDAKPSIEAAGGDPMLDRPADRTLKDDVLSELGRKVTRPHLTLAVPDRPGYSVDFDVLLDSDLLRLQAKQVTTTDAQGNLDADTFELALLVIASQCKGLRRNGDPVILDGERVTFTSPIMQETYSTDVRITVREFYGNDAIVGATFVRIQEAAQAGSLDPTDESSS